MREAGEIVIGVDRFAGVAAEVDFQRDQFMQEIETFRVRDAVHVVFDLRTFIFLERGTKAGADGVDARGLVGSKSPFVARLRLRHGATSCVMNRITPHRL
jgi:hypothetical protein